ncbi:MAG TPA: ribonuclease J [Thermodesulfobacteriota bacterium]|nr:ribonuclease J [Thermodesulfobacteriota bacterium]
MPLRLVPLGGLGEIGANCLAVEYGEALLLVDCGLLFPDASMLGIDLVLPDFAYLRRRRQALRAVFLTHGHEDHIGALPFLLKEFPGVPVYGTRLTLALAASRLEEHRVAADLRVVAPRQRVEVGPFGVTPIRVTHSIADGVGLAIETPEGTLLHTGDFKFDQTPIDGETTDYAALAGLGERGVLCLLSDSTNVERPGVTGSERTVGPALARIFRSAPGRIILATFASHIHRIQQVLQLAARFERKVALVGRSMVQNVKIAADLGYLRVPPGVLVELDELLKRPVEEQVVLSTGSQGEPLSALALMAFDNHKLLRVRPGDTVVLSARVIPGNELAIRTITNQLFRKGAEVVRGQASGVHVSGHAAREELRLMLNLVRPRHFVPIHGETRHLVKHRQLAIETGVAPDRAFLVHDGEVVAFERGEGWMAERVEAGRVFVDGKGVGDVERLVLRDRRHLAEEGIVVAVLGVNKQTGEIVSGPTVLAQGVARDEVMAAGDLLAGARAAVRETVEAVPPELRTDVRELEIEVRKGLRRYFVQRLDRRPVILPVVHEL